jgi:hypothetical protein
MTDAANSAQRLIGRSRLHAAPATTTLDRLLLTVPEGTPLGTALRSWLRHLRAANRSPKTLETHAEAVCALHRFLARAGEDADPARLRRSQLEAFMAWLLEHQSPATAHNRYRALEAHRRLSPLDQLR